MDIRVGDIVQMKKPHPCKSKSFQVVDISDGVVLKCLGCNHEIRINKLKAAKAIKKITREG